MQATLQQKVQILQALYGYITGQLTGASMDCEEAKADDVALEDFTVYGLKDAAGILTVAVAFAEHGNMAQMLRDVQMHDTLVREDVYENLRECECWSEELEEQLEALADAMH